MDRQQLEDFIVRLETAREPGDVFGPAPAHATPGDALAALHRSYRRLMQGAHPDLYTSAPGLVGLANRAARLLNRWLEEAERGLQSGAAAGSGAAAASAAAGAASAAVILDVGGERLALRERIAAGDLCDVHQVAWLDRAAAGGRWVAKLARDGANNDLVDAESQALTRLSGAPADEHEAFASYLPGLCQALRLPDGRHANVLERADGFYTLLEVREAYPDGVDAQALCWIFSRVLEALSWVHGQGLVHGAVLPEHVLIRPEDHGARLLDWCYARRIGAPLVALSRPYRSWYPPEVFAKAGVGAGVDLALAARTMLWLAGGSPLRGTLPPGWPEALGEVLRGCLIPDAAARYGDAFLVLERWREARRRVYGGLRYHPFTMPWPSEGGRAR